MSNDPRIVLSAIVEKFGLDPEILSGVVDAARAAERAEREASKIVVESKRRAKREASKTLAGAILDYLDDGTLSPMTRDGKNRATANVSCVVDHDGRTYRVSLRLEEEV